MRPPAPIVLVRLALLGVLLVSAVLVLVLVGPPDRSDVESAFAHPGLGAAVGYSALYAAVSLTPLPKPIFSLAAGAVFGVPAGVLVVLVGATTGATVAFWLGRMLGREIALRMFGSRAARWDDLLRDRGLWAVVVLRLAPVVPFTALNYLSGVTAIRPSTFLLGTAVGMTPATTAYVTIGAYGAQPGSWPFLVGVSGLAALTVVALIASRRHRRHPGRRSDPVEPSASA